MFIIFSWCYSEECKTKYSKFHISSKVYLEIPFSKNLYHNIKTNQLIWITSQLTGFYKIQVFNETCFPAGFRQILTLVEN